MTRVLVAYASKHGSTAEIAATISARLRAHGLHADTRFVDTVVSLSGYDAVVLGSAVYADNWRREALRFAAHFRDDLARRPVWLFSSGPLDHSADDGSPAPVGGLAGLSRLLGAREHAVFGGHLDEGASGLGERRMLRSGHGGDFRDFARIEAWADDIAAVLVAEHAVHVQLT